MLIFNGDKGRKSPGNRLKSALIKAYQDFLFPAAVILICLLGTYICSKTLETKNVFGGGGEKYIVIIIDDFGYGGEGSNEMLELGIPVTAAVMPGMKNSYADAKKYYEAGYDVILHQPMEAHNGKSSWLGPYGITAGLSDDQITQNVQNALETVEFAVGINNHMGSKIMENERIISRIMKIVSERDLIFVDSKTTGKSVAGDIAKRNGIRYYERDIFLDTEKSAENTKKQLKKAADIADKKGYAIVIGHVGTAGGKTTVRGIKEALPELLEKGYKFITISDLDLRMSMGFSD